MSTLERAIEIARKAHEGQTDKGGTPYINHPLRVMERVGPEEAKWQQCFTTWWKTPK